MYDKGSTSGMAGTVLAVPLFYELPYKIVRKRRVASTRGDNGTETMAGCSRFNFAIPNMPSSPHHLCKTFSFPQRSFWIKNVVWRSLMQPACVGMRSGHSYIVQLLANCCMCLFLWKNFVGLTTQL